MLNETIKAIRKAKGLSQEELAARLHVVRQTVSKWEQGLSVPDSDLLIALSRELETPVSRLLGEPAESEAPAQPEPETLRAIAEKLERINSQLARRKALRRAALHGTFLALCGVIAAVFLDLFLLKSPYLGWDLHDPETAVAGVALHAFEWLFVRLAPFALLGSAAGAFFTRKKI